MVTHRSKSSLTKKGTDSVTENYSVLKSIIIFNEIITCKDTLCACCINMVTLSATIIKPFKYNNNLRQLYFPITSPSTNVLNGASFEHYICVWATYS